MWQNRGEKIASEEVHSYEKSQMQDTGENLMIFVIIHAFIQQFLLSSYYVLEIQKWITQYSALRNSHSGEGDGQ